MEYVDETNHPFHFEQQSVFYFLPQTNMTPISVKKMIAEILKNLSAPE